MATNQSGLYHERRNLGMQHEEERGFSCLSSWYVSVRILEWSCMWEEILFVALVTCANGCEWSDVRSESRKLASCLWAVNRLPTSLRDVAVLMCRRHMCVVVPELLA